MAKPPKWAPNDVPLPVSPATAACTTCSTSHRPTAATTGTSERPGPVLPAQGREDPPAHLHPRVVEAHQAEGQHAGDGAAGPQHAHAPLAQPAHHRDHAVQGVARRPHQQQVDQEAQPAQARLQGRREDVEVDQVPQQVQPAHVQEDGRDHRPGRLVARARRPAARGGSDPGPARSAARGRPGPSAPRGRAKPRAGRGAAGPARGGRNRRSTCAAPGPGPCGPVPCPWMSMIVREVIGRGAGNLTPRRQARPAARESSTMRPSCSRRTRRQRAAMSSSCVTITTV